MKPFKDLRKRQAVQYKHEAQASERENLIFGERQFAGRRSVAIPKPAASALPLTTASALPLTALISTKLKSGLLVCFAMTVLLHLGCAGYHMGNQFLYRSDIRTVHVPVFESDSYRRFLGQRMTEAVIKQIELTTPLTIADPAVADSFVQGKIIRDVKRTAVEDFFDEPRVVQVQWLLEVKWVDRAGTPLMERQLLRINNDVDFIPEGGQSMATAEQELIDRIARQITGQMETPW